MSAEPVYSYGEPWYFSETHSTTYGHDYTNVILKKDGTTIQPKDRKRIVACVNFLAGIPSTFLETSKSTITSLICEWFRTQDDTVMCALYDEMQAVFDSIKTHTEYVSRDMLLEFVRHIVRVLELPGPQGRVTTFKDIKTYAEALKLLHKACPVCVGTGVQEIAGIRSICVLCQGTCKKKQPDFVYPDKEEKT